MTARGGGETEAFAFVDELPVLASSGGAVRRWSKIPIEALISLGRIADIYRMVSNSSSDKRSVAKAKSLALFTSIALAATACGGSEAPEALPLVDEAPASEFAAAAETEEETDETDETDDSNDDGTTDDGTADDNSADDDGTTDDDSPDDGTGETDETDEPEPAEVENPIGADSPPSPPGAAPVHVVVDNGKVYIRGPLPSEAVGGLLVATSESVVGEGNVFAEYTIDPDSTFELGAANPIYINDTVLFATGSATIAPDFFPILGQAVALLAVQPTAGMEIVGFTDSDGDEAANLALSQARVDAVRAWMIANGADPERVVATGKGESDPVAANDTAEGRAQNRRVEFLIDGLE